MNIFEHFYFEFNELENHFWYLLKTLITLGECRIKNFNI